MPSRIIGLSEDFGARRTVIPSEITPPGFKVIHMRPIARRGRGLADQSPQRIDLSGYVTTEQLGASYERLASMVLARKLSSEAEIGPLERYELCNLAGVPSAWIPTDLTNMLFIASPEQLGKGGFIGSITSAINHVVAPIAKVVSGVAKASGKLVSAVAPVLSAIPVVGPAISKVAGVAGAVLTEGSSLSMKSVVSNPAGILTGIAQEAQGVVAAGQMGGEVAAQQGEDQSFMSSLGQAVGAVPQAVQSITGDVAQAPANLLSGLGAAAMQGVGSLQGMISGVIGGGSSAPGGFGSDFWQGLKASDPGIGQLASSIESAMSSASPGSYIAKLGSTFASFTKSATGAVTVTQHPAGTVPSSIANGVPADSLTPIDPALLGTSNRVVGTSGAYANAIASNPNGVSQNPAGASLPAGPNGSGILSDPNAAFELKDAMSDAFGVAQQGNKLVPKAAPASSKLPLIILGGGALGAYGYFNFTKSGKKAWKKLTKGGKRRARRRKR